MSIESDLRKEGIEVINQLDPLISNSIVKNISRRIVETFQNFDLKQADIYTKLSNLKMYNSKMLEGMAEASYFHKNSSIYFNDHIDIEDIEEFAIHECLHYLQEVKDSDGNLLKMGLSDYSHSKFTALALNEAAVQYTASKIIGIEPDFEKYYDISFYTPSPSYYPIECALLNELIYFTGEDVLFKSTLFSDNDFKNTIIKKSSEKIFNKLLNNFNTILKTEESIIKTNYKLSLLEEGSSKIDKLFVKLSNQKKRISTIFLQTQNIIIKEFFDYEFNNISNLEELENYRKRLYKFSDIIGTVDGYNYFDNYYVEAMNKLEHKCNILENGGMETAISNKNQNKLFSILQKVLNIFYKNKQNKDEVN